MNTKIMIGKPWLSVCALCSFIMASSFPYILFGPLAGWIALGLLCFAVAMVRGEVGRSLRFQRGAKSLVIWWFLLVLAMLVLDIVSYVPRDLRTGPLLSFLTMLIFIGLFAASLRTPSRWVIAVVGSVTLVQGIVSVLQFFGTDWAWDISTTLVRTLPLQPSDPSLAIDMSDVEFSDIGRVRGTHMLVHNFNGVQSALIGVTTYMALNPDKRELPPGRLRLVVQAGVLMGTAGLLLSFSRSGILAVVGAIAMSLVIRPRLSKIVALGVGGVVVLVLLSELGFTSAVQFTRLLSDPQTDYNINVRLDQYAVAFDSFIKNPAIGASGLTSIEQLEWPIHSVPLRFLNDYGLVGFTLYLVIFGVACVIAVDHLISGHPQRKFWGGAAVCLMVAMVADGWTHSSGFLRRDIIGAPLLALLLGQGARAVLWAPLQQPWVNVTDKSAEVPMA